MTTRRPPLAVALLLLAALLFPVTDAPAARRQPEPEYDRIPGLIDRLRRLDPSEPMRYFELAEEVAYEMPSGAAQDLARRLFVLAYELDRRSDRPRNLGPSVCLALADISRRQDEKRWLEALAETLAPDRRWADRSADSADASDASRALEVAAALGHFRDENNRQAADRFARYDAPAMLARAGMPLAEAAQLVAEARATVAGAPFCRGCRGDRVVRRTVDGKPTVELCPICRGNPGARLTHERFRQTLRAEALLLRAEPRLWSVDYEVTSGRPLFDMDPDALAAWFEVDPDEPYFRPATPDEWRDGQWAAEPAAERTP